MTIFRRKQCKRCGEVKVLSKCNFYRRKDSRDGFRNECIPCSCLATKENRELKFEQYQQRQARYNALPAQREKRAAYARTERGRTAHRAADRRYRRFKSMEARA